MKQTTFTVILLAAVAHGAYAQNNKTAEETLKEFYTQYITEMADYDLDTYDVVEAMKETFLTKELIVKLAETKWWIDFFLNNNQDYDKAWLETLEINPVAGQENNCTVCYDYNGDRNCITLSLVQTGGRWLINDMDNIPPAGFPYNSFPWGTLTVETAGGMFDTFVSTIRPDVKLRMGRTYTDIFEYVEYEDDGDETSVTLKKGGTNHFMNADGLYDWVRDSVSGKLLYIKFPDLVRGQNYEIEWMIDTMRPAGDPEALFLEYFAVKATPVNDLYRTQAACGFKTFDYSTLPASWTQLTISGDDKYICRSADKFTIEGDTLTIRYRYLYGDDKSEYKIADASQRGDTITFDLKWTDKYSDRRFQLARKYIWFDRDREILMRVGNDPDEESVYYVPDERVSEYRTVTCYDMVAETLTVETDSTFVSSIRPDVKLRAGRTYTDIFEYVGHEEEGDETSVTLKKDSITLWMISSRLYNWVRDSVSGNLYYELPDLVRDEEYEIEWMIDTMRPAGDETLLWLLYFAGKVTPMKDLYRAQAAWGVTNFELYSLRDTISHDLNGDGIAERVFLNENKNIIIVDGGTGVETTFDGGSAFRTFEWINYWGVTTDSAALHTDWEKDVDEDGYPFTEEVQLLYPSVFVRQLHIGGGIITFRDGRYVWIHQND